MFNAIISSNTTVPLDSLFFGHIQLHCAALLLVLPMEFNQNSEIQSVSVSLFGDGYLLSIYLSIYRSIDLSIYLSVLFYFILFYSIVFYFILFYFILSYSILFYPILFYPILSYPILFYSILFYSILFYSVYLSVYLSIDRSIYLSVYLSIYLSISGDKPSINCCRISSIHPSYLNQPGFSQAAAGDVKKPCCALGW